MRNRERNPIRERAANTRKQNPRFVIFCEGEQTEPNYFRKFHYTALEVKPTGMNTTSVVDEAIQYRNENEFAKGDQIWVVFDRDSFPEDHVRQAFKLAKSHRIRCAYSNQAFELWFLMHFDYHDAALHRDQYKGKLTERLGRAYKKNDPGIYNALLDKQKMAIRNAKQLYESYETFDPIHCDPVTTVYELVEELNRILESTRRNTN